MKKLLLISVILTVLMFAACTKVLDVVNVGGEWTVYATISGKPYEFDMCAEQEDLFFEADISTSDIIFVEGCVSSANQIKITLEIGGQTFVMYGNTTEQYADGFVRKGEAGQIVGNWSMQR